jgi:hypothetical protein
MGVQLELPLDLPLVMKEEGERVGFFSGIEAARSSQSLPNISVGQYTFGVQAIKVFNSRGKGTMFVAEYEVLESRGEGANPVGTQCSHVIPLRLDSALGNIKNLVAALIGGDEKDVSEKMCEDLASEKNPAKGYKVKADAFIVPKKDGSPFTRVKYAPAADDTSKTEMKAA